AGLVPPQPDSPEQPSRTGNRPGYAWNTGAGVEPFRAAQAESSPAPGGTGAAQAGNGPPSAAALPGAALPGAALPGAALPGTGLPGAGLPGTGTPVTGTPGTGSPGAGTPVVSPSAVSEPGVSPTKRPSLALPRRLGGSTAGQSGGIASAGSGANPVSGGLAGQAPAGGGLAATGPAVGGFTGSPATEPASADPGWPSTGASQPPFPPAPRPATQPSMPG